jgi:hypothetical protein
MKSLITLAVLLIMPCAVFAYAEEGSDNGAICMACGGENSSAGLARPEVIYAS